MTSKPDKSEPDKRTPDDNSQLSQKARKVKTHWFNHQLPPRDREAIIDEAFEKKNPDHKSKRQATEYYDNARRRQQGWFI